MRFVVPLMGRDGALGAVEVVRLAEDFEERDRALLESLAAELAILVEHFLPAARPAVPPVPAGRRRLLPGRPEAGSARGQVGEEWTVLFADLRGYTSFAESHEPDQVVSLLNRYFGAAAPVILDEGGTVVQFVGDAVMAIWNAPSPEPERALRACRAALRMQARVRTAGRRRLLARRASGSASTRVRRWSARSAARRIATSPSSAMRSTWRPGSSRPPR